MYDLVFAPQALEDREWFKKHSNDSVKKKIFNLLKELEEHPNMGTGQPEKLSKNLFGCMSRRINREHRLLYQIDEEDKIVRIIQMGGHY